ncbi:uncharacterized protein C8Q71DRAFT_774251 [Rhodofomes roseus]|uniref:Uncharacterized protein n=1 Tax=Rhodofomes roseus TaxID=34475 RepID=A0ABQ8K7M0_9APHY|nr:uncharacterized protein C8Q71DRAFT_774251 [Rhodofomes roseus]KAH9833148.1 hypothetical protein C8Q71DRAFT_774251 [Rhodofomes roseus]
MLDEYEPYWFLHEQLEKEGIIVESIVPSKRRPNLYFRLACPQRGVFVISLYYHGCEKAILESYITRDQFSAMLEENKHILDLAYVQLNIPRTFGFLDKIFP